MNSSSAATRRDSALVLPLAALRDGVASAPGDAGAAGYVLVRVDGRAQARDVRLGLRTLDAVEVLEGLTAGDEVLLGGALEAGQRVRARPVAGPSARAAASAQDAGSALTNTMGR